MAEHPNPPAFPTEQGSAPDGTWNQTYDPGMTLLDYFAGKALVGYFSIAEGGCIQADAAEWAYDVAEMMLAERAKRITH